MKLTFGISAVIIAITSTAPSLSAADAVMPVQQQNAIIQRHCAVCHNDQHRNGGLSLQGFDVALPDNGVIPMLLSKLTSGIPLEKVKATAGHPAISDEVVSRIKNGALAAAGIPQPDVATQAALLHALADHATTLNQWIIDRQTGTPGQVSVSYLRELPPSDKGESNLYLLTVTCAANPNAAEIQVAWAAAVPEKNRTISVAVDGQSPTNHPIDGSEKRFKGAVDNSGTGAVMLFESNSGREELVDSLPKSSLTISGVFGNEVVSFPFDKMSQGDRALLSPCFPQ